MNLQAVETMQSRLLDLNESNAVILARAEAESRDLSAEEQQEFDRNADEFERIRGDVERYQTAQNQAELLSRSMGRRTEPHDPEPQNRLPDGNPGQPSQRRNASGHRAPQIEFREDRGKWGFRNFGDFAQAVRAACVRGGSTDPRLIANAPTTVSTEGIGADGGFAVPPDFRNAIMEKVMAEESLLSRTDQLQSGSNTIVLPKDETTPWQSTGGIQVYWEGENSQLTQSKIALGANTIRLNKLTALVPVSEELLDDAPSLDSYLRKKTPEKMDFAINDAIVNGTGVGKPLGILNAGCLVSVAKEASQAADTVLAENILKMYSRMYAPSRTRGVWLINQDIEPQLFTMSIAIKNVAGTDNVGGMPVYMPPNGLSATPFGTLLGRPIIPTQACQTLGDKGDIIFADLSQYMTALKTAGIRADVSMHLWFDFDTLAYRFILRLAGQPWWASTIAPLHGNNALSCFVTLDERA